MFIYKKIVCILIDNALSDSINRFLLVMLLGYVYCMAGIVGGSCEVVVV